MEIFIVVYETKYGQDVSAFSSMEKAENFAESIRLEFHKKAKSYQDIAAITFGEQSIEIITTFLEI